MNYKNFFYADKYYLSFIFFPLIFYLITFDNPFYSDDYQTIIGLKLFNLIHGNSYFGLKEAFNLRTDGHLAPILYLMK